MARGSPNIDVRAPADQQAAWKELARKAGVTYSQWVREACEDKATAARYPNGPPAPIVAESPAPAFGPSTPMVELSPADCLAAGGHPRDRREAKPYGSICGRCGMLLGVNFGG